MIKVDRPGLATLDYGPLQMTIFASRNAEPQTEAVKTAALFASKILDELAAVRSQAQKPQAAITASDQYPEILQTMIAAVRRSGDKTLTPMAAVAGSIADMVADYLYTAGATKVIVNNGGDIALRLSHAETVAVGVAPVIGGSQTHILQVKAGDGIGGIATSGLGGRSFTKGIATAAVVVAQRAALADACATSIANATYAPHASIKLGLAGNIDPDSDIADHLVVYEVDDVPAHIAQQALANGYEQALALYRQKLIAGAALFICNWGVMLPDNLMKPAADIQIEEGLLWKFAKS
jgi:hypothetical protein